ncbi:MAG TPA: YciI family protein [Gemmatimonadales bacterium]|jgi:hypothetical protein
MRYMTIVRTREGQVPPPALLEKIDKLAAEMVDKGVWVGAGGLGPTAAGARLRLANGKITVKDGPFSEAKEVVGGYAIFDVASKQEALEWARRFLETHIGLWPHEIEVELRPMMDDPSQRR